MEEESTMEIIMKDMKNTDAVMGMATSNIISTGSESTAKGMKASKDLQSSSVKRS